MILSCTCKHEYQDQKYGKGMRVHNMVPDPNGSSTWRCTVCLNNRTGAAPTLNNKKKSKKN